jgi:phosphoglycerol geranylgeranyltransferase
MKKSGIYSWIVSCTGRKKLLAVLLDPDWQDRKKQETAVRNAEKCGADLLLVGGSLISQPIDSFVEMIKQHTSLPVVLFPGSLLQLSARADAMLLLSMISGRNPELLIGNHVAAAPMIRKSGIEVIAAGYMLIEGGKQTSVEYMSNTRPIPAAKSDIAVATALAGEMLGLKLIYLEAGSGADKPVPLSMIRAVRSSVSLPIMVGGGLKTPKDAEAACQAGADIIVIGSAAEKNQKLLQTFARVIHG